MPPFETMDLYQKAVVWEKSETEKYDLYGEPIIQAPAEVDCRWVWKRSETVNQKGETIALDATVIVAQEIAVESQMVLGKLADLTGSETKLTVKTSGVTPDIKGVNTRYELGLGKSSDTLAQLEGS